MTRENGVEVMIRGYLYALAAAACWAGCSILAKYLFNRGFPPADLVTLRLWLSAALLFAVLAWRSPGRLRLTGAALWRLGLLGATNAGMQFCYFLAISLTSVAAAIYLQYLAPVLVAVWGVLAREEALSGRTLAALVLATTGCFLLATAGSLSALEISPGGLASGLAAAVFFAAYTVQSQRGLRRHDSLTVLAYALLFGALTWSLHHPPWQLLPGWLAPLPAGAIVVIAAVGTILPFWLYLKSLGLLPPTHTITTSTAEPLMAMFLAFVLLGETLLLGQVMGGLLIVLAICVLALGARAPIPSGARVGIERRHRVQRAGDRSPGG
jgi:drug/metabolite transporter (DMT)-like permease